MDIKKYIYGHCVNPQKVEVYDAYLGETVVRSLPCGKCLHCLNTHINEWVTRLCAQKKYSKYVYFVSLDYAPFDINNSSSMHLAHETAAVFHNINRNKSYGLQPLLLCKNHLQDFFKRLRKNTGIKFQYFACGEYGMHANGKGFGRPHFHIIIFSNELLSPDLLESAWTVNGYKIGRVDFKDLSSFGIGDDDSIKCFKYVCKYLQKSDFVFEELATIDYHRAYYKSLISTYNAVTDEVYQVKDTNEFGFTWSDYCKKYAPFVVCSRRPSIGAQYFEENVERFKAQDFRLFGLPSVCTSFPRYYLRRTKETLFNFQCLGQDSQKPSSLARMGYICKILNILQDNRDILANPCVLSEDTGRNCYKKKNVTCFKLGSEYIPVKHLSFYDNKNKFLYQFDGVSYNVWAKMKGNYVLLDIMDISVILSEIQPSWDRFHTQFLEPLYRNRIRSESEFVDSISYMYDGDSYHDKYENFMKDVWSRYQVEISDRYKTKLLTQNSKIEL